MAIKINTFLKEERLCSEKLLSLLFHKGSSFLVYPFRVTYIFSKILNFNQPAQVVFPVSKKKFKKSVHRHLLTRRMREIYRLNKATELYLWLKADEKLLLSVAYIGKEIHDYSVMEKKMLLVFKQLRTTVEGINAYVE